MRTVLPDHVQTIDEAKALLKALYDNGECFHPEDNPHDVIQRGGDPLFTTPEADRLEVLMEEVYRTTKANDFDPCGYILSLDPDYVQE